MKKNFLYLFLLAFTVFLLTNCENSNISDGEDSLNVLVKHREGEYNRLDVGLLLSQIIENDETNSLLKEVLGDEEVPYFDLQNVGSRTKNFGSLLDETAAESDATFRGISTAQILREDPLLNLYVFYPEDYDGNELTEGPLQHVAVVTGQGDRDPVFLIDERKKISTMTEDDIIEVPTLVLKINEELTAVSNRTFVDLTGRSYADSRTCKDVARVYYSTETHTIYRRGDLDECVDHQRFFIDDELGPWDCDNGVQDYWEDGIDCGGPFCAPCQPYGSCNDGIQNGLETGVDCGGPNCVPCVTDPPAYDGLCTPHGPSDRDQNTSKDYLHSFKLKDCDTWGYVNQKEAVKEGKYFEFKVFIIFAQANGTIGNLTKTKAIKKKKLRKKTWIFWCKHTLWYDFQPDLEIVTWNPNTYGDAMKYGWTEEDPSATLEKSYSVESKFKIDSVAFTVSGDRQVQIKEEDDILGESVVEYCDDTDGNGTLYTTGDVEFYVRQH